MAEIVWTTDALADLDSIVQHIARRSPEYAPVFVQKVVDAVERLGDFPRLGRVAPEFNDRSLREIIFQNYRIIYKIQGEIIAIIAVWHGAVDLRRRITSRPWDFT